MTYNIETVVLVVALYLEKFADADGVNIDEAMAWAINTGLITLTEAFVIN